MFHDLFQSCGLSLDIPYSLHRSYTQLDHTWSVFGTNLWWEVDRNWTFWQKLGPKGLMFPRRRDNYTRLVTILDANSTKFYPLKLFEIWKMAQEDTYVRWFTFWKWQVSIAQAVNLPNSKYFPMVPWVDSHWTPLWLIYFHLARWFFQ